MHDVKVSSMPKLYMLAPHVSHAVCQPLLALKVACSSQHALQQKESLLI